MKRMLLSFLVLSLLFVGVSISFSADMLRQPVPTLVPPTLVPTQDAGVSDALLSESGLARVQQDGRVRVGLLYNAPPFGELNVRGEVAGYDADLARSMAEAWGVTFEPVQVTRQTALDALKVGAVDMLVASQVHRRDLDAQVEFSLTYYSGSQVMLVRQDDAAVLLADMANRRVGYVLATPSAEAIGLWQGRSGIGVTVQQYLTLDQAITALVNNEVDGVVANRIQFTVVLSQQGTARVLDESVGTEPLAVVVRRQDVNWRNLINKTLQYLVRKGRMQEIQQAYFGTIYPLDLVPIWAGIGDDAPKPDQFPADVPYPSQYALPRIQSSGVVRVAGITDVSVDVPESERRLDVLNRAIIEALVTLWGMQVEYIPNSVTNAVDLVASGQADLAVGIPLDWSYTDRVDLTAPYFLHGDRLMVKKNDDYETFIDLRGRVVGIFASEPGVADRVNALAESVSSGVRIFTINREQDAALEILDSQNALVVFGDSLKLIPHVQTNPDLLRLSVRGNNPDPWYNRTWVGIAVPRNDIDFRLLVEYSLQELARNGTLQSLLTPVMLPEEIPAFGIWPGTSDYLGFKLG
ncbi:MAG: transporter substrate-binding domain-containing protein [Anaerolineae bacterium]|nr:transporter substrate-binding domain-containing protein [Anaerolineae bacterium]